MLAQLPSVGGRSVQQLTTSFTHIRGFLGRFHAKERFFLFLFASLFVLGVTADGYQEYLSQTVVVPAVGGEYIEGVVGNRSQLDDLVTRITSVGLVSLTKERKPVPMLAKEWGISQDGKTYTFHLFDGLSSDNLAKLAREQDIFKTVDIETPDARTLVFRLKQPFGPFLSLAALPIFPHGPYELTDEREDTVTFTANTDFPQGRPFLERITIRVFPDERSLEQAIAKKELSGAVSGGGVPGWRTYQANLPRRIAVIFNTDLPSVKTVETREKIIKGTPLAEKVTLTLATTPQLKSHAEDFKRKWGNQNVDLTVKLVEDAELLGTVIPQRGYDVILYGIDVGIDPDPFRFWHSSQAISAGFNLAQLKDKDLDGLLEEARKIVDDSERFKKYEEIEKKIDELAVRIPVKELTITYQVSGDVKGIEEPLMTTAGSRYNLVWKWYTKERRVPKK